MTVNTIDKKQAVQQTELERIFKLQKANQKNVANTTAVERIAKLKKLHDAILKYKKEIHQAVYNDFRKHGSEVDLTEILPITTDIKHTCGELRKWMRPTKVSTPMTLLGTSSKIIYEAKGVVLIISPWNFPINLTFCPLISAIAAGNCVILKPSENTPHSSAVMKKIVNDIFDENEIALFEGDHTVASGLLQLPFNHIFFTGSPQIGKIVMRAAAEHLASVTLELGGKSPTIVDETANLNEAASKIAWAKFMNNGQICIAPDYLYVHESKKDKFIELLKKKTAQYYGESDEDKKQSESYARMVNARHYKRVKGLVEDATSKGATVEMGAQFDDSQNYIAPTILTNVSMDANIMDEEIFGPVLPIHTFSSLEEPLSVINAKEKPLALYIYSNSNKNISKVMDNTSAGGTCINESILHFMNANLPFGGINNSGIGKSHGIFGFKAFSNERAVLKQHTRFSANKLMMPPYNKRVQQLIDLTIKWF